MWKILDSEEPSNALEHSQKQRLTSLVKIIDTRKRSVKNGILEQNENYVSNARKYYLANAEYFDLVRALAFHCTSTDYQLMDGAFDIIAALDIPCSPDGYDFIRSKPMLLRIRGTIIRTDFWGPVASEFLDSCCARIVFLDLSHSTITRGIRRNAFTNLRILKLQRCGLNDNVVCRILDQLPHGRSQLSSLDLWDNILTDRTLKFFDCGEVKIPDPSLYGPSRYLIRVPDYATQLEYQTAAANAIEDGVWDASEFDEIDDTANAFMKATKGETPHRPATGVQLVHVHLTRNRFSAGAVLRYLCQIGVPTLRTFDSDVALSGDSVSAAAQEFYGDNYEFAEISAPSLLAFWFSYHKAPRLRTLAIHHSFVTNKPDKFRFSEGRWLHTQTYSSTVRSLQNKANRNDLDGFDALYSHNELKPFALPPAFEPEMNSNIEDLTLYHLPEFANRTFVDALIRFFEEANIQETKLQALRDRYRDRGRRSLRILPGLRRLTLIFVPNERMMSVTEDPDVEDYLAAAKDDFSFFPQEKSSTDAGKGKAKAKDAAFAGYWGPDDRTTSVGEDLYNVIKCLEKFREATKGTRNHWCGELKVIKKIVPW